MKERSETPPTASSRGPRRDGRRPGRARRWILRPLVWAAVLLAVLLTALYLAFTSPFVRHRVAEFAAARVSEYLGRPVQIGSIDYGLVPLEVEVRDVVIPGPRSDSPPLARLPYLRLEVSIEGLEPLVLRLRQIDLVEPELLLRFEPDGSTNLPQIAGGGGGGKRGIEVQLDRLLVERGVVQIDERRLPLDLSARALWGRLTASGKGGDGGYRLLVTAQDVVTTLPKARPWGAAVSLKGTLGSGGVELAAGRVRGPGLDAALEGSYRWEGVERRLELAVDARGESSLANRLGYLEPPVSGPFRFAGTMRVDGESWTYGGTLRAPEIRFLDRRFTDVRSQLDGDAEGLRIDLDRAAYAAGRFRGTLHLDTRAEPVRGDVDVAAADVSLRALLSDAGLALGGLAGRMGGELRYRFTTDDPLGGDGTAELRLSAVRRPGDRLELAGAAPLVIRSGICESDAIHITAPGQALAGQGRFDLASATGELSFRLQTEDLEPLGRLLPPPASGAEPFWLPTGGRGELAGSVSLAASALSGHLGFALRQLAVAGLTLDELAGSFDFTPERLENLRARAGSGGGSLLVDGSLPLTSGEAGGSSPGPRGLELTADLNAWPAASLAPLVPSAPEVTGEVGGHLEVGGTFDRPVGRLEIAAAPLTVAGLELERVDANAVFQGNQVHLTGLEARGPVGEARLSGSYDAGDGALDFHLEAPALDLSAEPFAAVFAGDLSGSLGVTVDLGGTLDAPRGKLDLRGSHLVLAGRPLGEEGTSRLEATWESGRVNATGSLLGLVDFDGGGTLDRQAVDLAFGVRSSRVRGLLEVFAETLPIDLTGSFEGQLRVSGRTEDLAAVAARLELDRLELAYEEHEVHNLEPVVARLSREALTFDSVYLGEAKTGSELFVAGTLGLGGAEVPLDLKVQSSLSVAWLELLLPGWRLGGSFDILGTVKGTLEEPRINGQGEVRQGQLTLPTFPHSLTGVAATVLFYPDEVVLDSLTGDLAGGTVRVAGRLTLPTQPGSSFTYRLQGRAENLTVRYPEGMLIRGDAEVALSSIDGGRQLQGTVDLDRAFYLQDVRLGFTDLLQRVFQRERIEVAETAEELASTQLNLSVRGPGALRVRNNLADLRGSIDLTLRGTLARPVIFGQVEVEPGGKIVYRDTRYTVDRGLLTFANPYRIEPVIDLVAETTIKPYDIRLNLSGTLDRMNATFSSDPPLADLDILGLLTTGKTFGEGSLAGRGVGETQFGATSFLYGQAASVISERVNSLFGFDKFRINPGASGDVTGSIGLTVEKRLSPDLALTYTRDPATPERDIVQVSWDATRRLTLIFTREGDGSFAVDTQWGKSF